MSPPAGTATARVGWDAQQGRATLRVLDGGGTTVHRADLPSPRPVPRRAAPPAEDGDVAAQLLALADDGLGEAGWVRVDGWAGLPAHVLPAASASPSSAPVPAGRWEGWTAAVCGVPRQPLDGAGARVLTTLEYLTRAARSPVTASALVPHAAPTLRLATVVLQRLVAGGHVRPVGRTDEARPRRLYAVVGSRWAPGPAGPAPAQERRVVEGGTP